MKRTISEVVASIITGPKKEETNGQMTRLVKWRTKVESCTSRRTNITKRMTEPAEFGNLQHDRKVLEGNSTADARQANLLRAYTRAINHSEHQLITQLLTQYDTAPNRPTGPQQVQPLWQKLPFKNLEQNFRVLSTPQPPVNPLSYGSLKVPCSQIFADTRRTMHMHNRQQYCLCQKRPLGPFYGVLLF